MLKTYLINGKQWQYEEGEQPAGAVEVFKVGPVKAEPKPEPVQKAVEKPANKARTPVNKSAKVKGKK